MRALVTGGCGFVGSHLVQHLVGEGHRVVVLDDLSSGNRSWVPPEAELRVGSVLDADAVRRAGRGAEIVYHLAMPVGMRLVTRRPRHAFEVGSRGTFNLLRGTGDTPAVLVSSSAVYGLAGASATAEHAARLTLATAREYDAHPRGYAAGKIVAERLARRAARQGRALLVVRPFNLVGIRQSAAYGMVLPRFVERALAGRPLAIYDDGRQLRSFSCARTFVREVVRLAAHPAGWDLADPVLNVGSGWTISVLELAELVLQATGSRSRLRFIPYDRVYPGKRDVRVRIPDLSGMERRLGPVAWPHPREVVREVAHWWRGQAPRSAALAGHAG